MILISPDEIDDPALLKGRTPKPPVEEIDPDEVDSVSGGEQLALNTLAFNESLVPSSSEELGALNAQREARADELLRTSNQMTPKEWADFKASQEPGVNIGDVISGGIESVMLPLGAASQALMRAGEDVSALLAVPYAIPREGTTPITLEEAGFGNLADLLSGKHASLLEPNEPILSPMQRQQKAMSETDPIAATISKVGSGGLATLPMLAAGMPKGLPVKAVTSYFTYDMTKSASEAVGRLFAELDRPEKERDMDTVTSAYAELINWPLFVPMMVKHGYKNEFEYLNQKIGPRIDYKAERSRQRAKARKDLIQFEKRNTDAIPENIDDYYNAKAIRRLDPNITTPRLDAKEPLGVDIEPPLESVIGIPGLHRAEYDQRRKARDLFAELDLKDKLEKEMAAEISGKVPTAGTGLRVEGNQLQPKEPKVEPVVPATPPEKYVDQRTQIRNAHSAKLFETGLPLTRAEVQAMFPNAGLSDERASAILKDALSTDVLPTHTQPAKPTAPKQRTVEPLNVLDLEPALVFEGKAIPGGTSHLDILQKLSKRRRLQYFEERIKNPSKADRRHQFRNKRTGEVYSRQKLQQLLGTKDPVTSEMLLQMQMEAGKGTPTGKQPAPVAPIAPEIITLAAKHGAKYTSTLRGYHKFDIPEFKAEIGIPENATPEQIVEKIQQKKNEFRKDADEKIRVQQIVDAKAKGLKPENVEITVTPDEVDAKTGEVVPGYVSVNGVLGGDSKFSNTPEVVALHTGFEIPTAEQLKKLPGGKHTLPEAVAKLKAMEAKPVTPAAPAEPKPLSAIEVAKKALDDYESGERDLTPSDIADELETIYEDLPEPLQHALNVFREEQRYDKEELGGRGDQDTYDSNFIEAVRKETSPVEKPVVPVEKPVVPVEKPVVPVEKPVVPVISKDLNARVDALSDNQVSQMAVELGLPRLSITKDILRSVEAGQLEKALDLVAPKKTTPVEKPVAPEPEPEQPKSLINLTKDEEARLTKDEEARLTKEWTENKLTPWAEAAFRMRRAKSDFKKAGKWSELDKRGRENWRNAKNELEIATAEFSKINERERAIKPAPAEKQAPAWKPEKGKEVVYYLTKGLRGKGKLATAVQVAEDGDVQVFHRYTQQYIWIKKERIFPPRKEQRKIDREAEIAHLSEAEQKQVKTDAADFIKLVKEVGPEMEWIPGEALGTTDMPEHGVRNRELVTAGVKAAFNAAGMPDAQVNSLLDRAAALPKLRKFLEDLKKSEGDHPEDVNVDEIWNLEGKPNQDPQGQIKRLGVVYLPNGDSIRIAPSDTGENKYDVYFTKEGGERERINDPADLLNLDEARKLALDEYNRRNPPAGEQAPPEVQKPTPAEISQAEMLKQRIKDRLKGLQGGGDEIIKGYGGRKKQVIRKVTSEFANKAIQENEERGKIFSDAVQYGAFVIQDGAHKFEPWSVKMREAFGDGFTDQQLKSIYANSKISVYSPHASQASQKSAGLSPGLRPASERILTARPEQTRKFDESGIPEEHAKHLGEHQKQGVAAGMWALDDIGATLNADGTGVGKTRESLTIGAIHAKNGWRVIYVVPKATVGIDWKKNTFGGSYWNDSRKMGIPLKLQKDAKVKHGELGLTTYENVKELFENSDDKTLLIFDEAHALKNDSIRSREASRAMAKAGKVMFLSATPADKPVHIEYLNRIGILEGKSLESALRDLGMKLVQMPYIDKYTGQKAYKQVWAEDGNILEKERNDRFSALFDRMTKNGVMIKREISMQGTHVQALKIMLPPEAHDVQQQILNYFGAEKIEDLSSKRKAIALGHMRRIQEPYKIASTVMLAKRELAAGRQVVIFLSRVNDTEVGKWVTDAKGDRVRDVLMRSDATTGSLINALNEAGIYDIAEIHGEAEQGKNEAMDDFQNGKKRVVIATMESGGTGINLDDVAGNRPRSMIVMTAPFSAVDNVQAAGRIWRLTTMSRSEYYYLFGDTEVDQWNADIIGSKMSHLGAVVEGEVRNLDISDPDKVTMDDFRSEVRSPKPGDQISTPIPGAPVEQIGSPVDFPKLEWKPTRGDSMMADPTPEFWDWWNASGKKANKYGVTVSNFKGKWYVWSKTPHEAGSSPEKISGYGGSVEVAPAKPGFGEIPTDDAAYPSSTSKGNEIHGWGGSVADATPPATPAEEVAQIAKATPLGNIGTIPPTRKNLLSVLAPTWKSKQHLDMAVTTGKFMGTMNRWIQRNSFALQKYKRAFDKLGTSNERVPLEQNPGMQFASDMSQGREMTGWKKDAADQITKIFDNLLVRLVKAGVKFKELREFYFPGMWTTESRRAFNLALQEAIDAKVIPEEFDLNMATPSQMAFVKERADKYHDAKVGSDRDMFSYLTKNPIQGKESFRKEKIFDDIMTAVKFGLRPVHGNPIALAKLKMAEMERSVMGHEVINERKRKGFYKRIGAYDQVPENWEVHKEIIGPPTIKLSEYVDKAGYEGLLKVAKKMGVTHERLMKVGRGGIVGLASSAGWTQTQFATGHVVLAHELGHQLQYKYDLWDKLVNKAEGIGKSGKVTKEASQRQRGLIKEELRALSDFTFEGTVVSESHKRYTREKDEQMAHLLEAYVYAPEKFVEIAPTMFKVFDDFVSNHPIIKDLAEIKHGLALKKLTQEKYVGKRIMGKFIMPKADKEILDNYLSSSLYNNPVASPWFKPWMYFANALNRAQLGLGSAFHASFTTGEAQISSGANLIKDIYGLFQGNRSASDLANSLRKWSTASINTAGTGDAVINAWRNPKEVTDPKIQMIAQAAELAGARFDQERGLKADEWENVVENWYGKNRFTAALKSPVAFTEALSKPIMEFLVPRQKAGVFADMAWRIIEMNPNMPLEDLAPQFRQAWNRVDARLGQVAYDRLFMHNVAKNFMQAMIRAPGWTGGTVLEIGGAFPDAAKFLKEWKDTGKMPENIPDRMAYVISLLLHTFIVNAILTYAFTGKQPEGMDYWAFQVGTKDRNGNTERFFLPTYGKDIVAWYKHPATTALHKTHPVFSMVGDVMRNEDYYGYEVYDPNANAAMKVGQGAKYVAKQFEPFWTRGVRKASEQGVTVDRVIAPYFGVMPAPAYMTQTDVQQKISYLFHKRTGQAVKPYGTQDKEKKPRGWAGARSNNQDPFIRMYKRLPDSDQEAIGRMMNPQEREKFGYTPPGEETPTKAEGSFFRNL